MTIISIKDNDNNYLEEYIKLCSLEWGTPKSEEELKDYIKRKKESIHNDDEVIDILALINGGEMIGFISLFKTDGDERNDLSPWYATMYVKKNYRGNGYSKILNNALIDKAKEMGYKKVYLKSDLKNYYEKFGARYIERLKNNENLFYIDII